MTTLDDIGGNTLLWEDRYPAMEIEVKEKLTRG